MGHEAPFSCRFWVIMVDLEILESMNRCDEVLDAFWGIFMNFECYPTDPSSGSEGPLGLCCFFFRVRIFFFLQICRVHGYFCPEGDQVHSKFLRGILIFKSSYSKIQKSQDSKIFRFKHEKIPNYKELELIGIQLHVTKRP